MGSRRLYNPNPNLGLARLIGCIVTTKLFILEIDDLEHIRSLSKPAPSVLRAKTAPFHGDF